MPTYRSPIDLTQNEIRNAVVQNLASAPGSPKNGQLYYNTGSNTLIFWNGSSWTTLATGTTPDATTGAKGIVQLANDLGGTATAPTVVALHLAADTAINHKLTSVTDPGAAQDAATKNYVDTRTLNNFVAPTADLSINSHKLTNVTDPTAGSDAATKNYVDGVASGLVVKGSVVAATTGSETYTIASGSVTQINGTTIDGVSPAIGDRILVKDAPSASGVGSANSTQPGNGIYTVTGNTTNLTVARSTDMSGTNVPQGAFTFVEGGTVNLSSGWVVSVPSTTGAFTYGTNNIKWTQFSGAGEITAGTGLSKSGNTLSIENSGVLLPTHGGTGVASPAAHALLLGNGASVMTSLAPSATTGVPLISNGSSADPSYGALALGSAGTVSGSLPLANGGTGSGTAAGARTGLGTGSFFATTFTGNGVATTFTYTPASAPVQAGAWQVTIVNQSTGAIEQADVVVNQATNTPVTGAVNQIQISFGTAPTNGLVYSLLVQG